MGKLVLKMAAIRGLDKQFHPRSTCSADFEPKILHLGICGEHGGNPSSSC